MFWKYKIVCYYPNNHTSYTFKDSLSNWYSPHVPDCSLYVSGQAEPFFPNSYGLYEDDKSFTFSMFPLQRWNNTNLALQILGISIYSVLVTVWTRSNVLPTRDKSLIVISTSIIIRARLHQASASTLRQLCNDSCNSVLIENNGITWKWVAIHSGVTPLFSMKTELLTSSKSITVLRHSLVSLQGCRGVYADTWCKWAPHCKSSPGFRISNEELFNHKYILYAYWTFVKNNNLRGYNLCQKFFWNFDFKKRHSKRDVSYTNFFNV